jgi:hypothetical protein
MKNWNCSDKWNSPDFVESLRAMIELDDRWLEVRCEAFQMHRIRSESTVELYEVSSGLIPVGDLQEIGAGPLRALSSAKLFLPSGVFCSFFSLSASHLCCTCIA